ncbi:MAG: hypothetical protein HYV90_04075 [Candidatus Woesebacteria bacterium]|nr:MAG: hypothetical protein HYV90_04075 [Candidatus Woesebacteria bacterium]
MLKVGTTIDHGNRVRLDIDAKLDGMRLYFMKNIAPKTWKAEFWITLNRSNFAAFRDQLNRLVYGKGDIYSVTEAKLDGVKGQGEVDFSLFVTEAQFGWFVLTIRNSNTAVRTFECKIRRTELINFMDETTAFLME